MCGFTGYFDPAFNHEEYIIKEMSNQIISRGPDSYGIHIDRDIGISLGHRRLSIQDLSENGSQPMHSVTKRFTLVFNGEIYNHLDLRKLIESKTKTQFWKGTSDTETLLALFENFGIHESLNLLNGMFSFAIFFLVSALLDSRISRDGEKYFIFWLKSFSTLFSSISSL